MSYSVNWQLIERVVGNGNVEDYKGETYDEIVRIITDLNEEWKHGDDEGMTEEEISEAAADLEYLNRRKPGRPPIADKRKIRTIKMTNAEWQEIQARAMAAGISAGEYIRQAALREVGA